MPLKKGGGNHYQLYNPKNGEYTDQEIQEMRDYDNYAISLYKANGNDSIHKFHFPIMGVHEDDYSKDFVLCVKENIKNIIYKEEKMNYLLSFQVKTINQNF